MLDISRTLFAFARFHRVMNESYLRQQEAHGKRTSPTAAIRPGANPALSLFWSRFGSESGAYVDDLRAYLREIGARTRGGAAISAHLLLGVSPEWLKETGGIHDGSNTRVKRLFEEAKSFAEIHIGGVYAMRMDLDERGSGVVDIFATHTHMRRGRPRKDGTRGKDVHEVSIKEALSGLQLKAGGGKSFAALQTLWAHHAATNLDCRIVRGVEKTITGREHLTVAEYRQSVEAEKTYKAERDGQRKTILNTFAFIAERDGEAEERGLHLDQREVGLKALADCLAVRSGYLDDAVRSLKEAEEALATREILLDAREKALATRATTATQHEERNAQRGRELVQEELRCSKKWPARDTVRNTRQSRADRQRAVPGTPSCRRPGPPLHRCCPAGVVRTKHWVRGRRCRAAAMFRERYAA